jgi:transposase
LKKNVWNRAEIVNEETLIVTVDLGKYRCMGYYRCPDGSDGPCFEFYNTGEGFKEFWRKISGVMRAHGLTEVVVGFESTGPYGEPLMHFLNKRGVKLVQVNPSHTKKVKEVLDNSPHKSDEKDPKVIADLIQLGRFLSVVIPEGAAAELRRLNQARDRAVVRRTSLYNQLHDLVFLMCPKFLHGMRDLKTRSARYLLAHYPTPEAVVRLGVEGLTEVLKRVSRGRLGPERAAMLYEAARDSVGLEDGVGAMVMEIQEILSLIDACDRFVVQLEEEMASWLEEIPYSGLILSIKGLGKVTVAGLIGEVGDFRKFKTIAEVVKLAGLNLYEISSGLHRGRRRISKHGRSLLRKLLYFAAVNVVRKGGVMHEVYQRHLQKGMPKLKALVAICRKLLGVIFALVRDHSEYIPDYERVKLLRKAA